MKISIYHKNVQNFRTERLKTSRCAGSGFWVMGGHGGKSIIPISLVADKIITFDLDLGRKPCQFCHQFLCTFVWTPKWHIHKTIFDPGGSVLV